MAEKRNWGGFNASGEDEREREYWGRLNSCLSKVKIGWTYFDDGGILLIFWKVFYFILGLWRLVGEDYI